MKATITTTVDVELTPEQLGEMWANLDDDAQARFFVAAAKIAVGWERKIGGWDWQFYSCGSHLRNCECSTEDARDLIRAIASGLENGSH